jgi:preprotein translocase subunit SecA
LHQAIEAKENVKIQSESQTLAAITFQNYFRMYKKLAGMTGTAMTEADEFAKIYNLAVVEIPTNKPVDRKDQHDVIYKNKMAKFTAIVKEIKERNAKGQPMLVGTISIENSELLSGMLTRSGIKHNVLNAKQHAREAEIIKDAGQRGTVTIATNMAGRGTDIVLGSGVTELGGLHVIGTERHESRRIDNQLRGRCGRQGDPGSSRFYISLEDDLMRIFGGQRVSSMMERFNIPEDTPIEHSLITGSIERAQKKVEQYHFSMRKQVLQYDDVMNRQRTTIYALRRKLLREPSIKDKILEMQKNIVDRYSAQGTAAEPAALEEIFPLDAKPLTPEALLNEIVRLYQIKEDSIGSELMRDIEKMVVLRELDRAWIDHLHNLDVLREGIGLRAYGQQDPLVEYKIEGFKMFQAMLANIEESVCSMLFRVQVVREDEQRELAQQQFKHVDYHGGDLQSDFGLRSPLAGESAHRSHSAEEKQQPVHVEKTVGRNDPCPCGSGKKYKKCCGAGKE